MITTLINKIVDLIVSPYGVLAIPITLLVLELAKRYRRVAWLLFSLFCFTASLGKYEDPWIKEPPALVFPLQQLRDLGRPLTIVLLALLLLLIMQLPNGWRRMLTPRPITYLALVQVAVFFKILAFGNIIFAFLGLLTFFAVVMVIRLGPARWVQNEHDFCLGVWGLAMGGVIFAVANAYQGLFDMQPLTFTHGRFLGTTGNPQHAAAFLAATIPCIMFLIEKQKKWDWSKGLWITSLLLIGYFLFLTGSRTGAIMGFTSILLFYRQRVGDLLRLGIIIGVVLALIFAFSSPDSISENTQVSSRFLSTENTREEVWSALWNNFSQYPLFGSPLYGERLVFAENSWLAVGSNIGLLGFIPMVMMGIGCLKMLFQIYQLGNRKPIYFLHTSTVIAGLSGLLSGSFSEAYLVGNLSFPVIALMTYLSLGKYLLDIDNLENKYLLNINSTL